MHITIRWTSALLALITSTSVLAGPPAYTFLEKSRPFLKFPEYSKAERKLVLSQTKMIVNDVYVNKDLKIKHFGVNPEKSFTELEAQYESMPIEEFHTKISQLFLSFRDRHMFYYFPRPFACHISFLPVMFREVLDDSGKPVITVRKLDTNDEINAMLESPLKIKKGDILLTYDGMPAEEAVMKIFPITAGANVSAQRHIAINTLNFRDHSLDLLPEKDSITAVFKNRQGKIYTQELPWISKKDWACIGNDQAPPMKSREMKIGNAEAAGESIVRSVISNPYGSFGLLEIYNFDTEEVDKVIQQLKDILKTEFKDTDGLIIDVRGNGGGNLGLAEKMLQLVSPKRIHPVTKIMKTTDPIFHYFNSTAPDDSFTKALVEARKENRAYTKPLPLLGEEEVNEMGQFYFRPVAIFTDGFCYSSCDVLSAQLQDHGLATVFGEAESTGGGGANVFKLTKFLDDLGTNRGPFAPLPKGQNILFALRQTIRTGLNAGKLIEDDGIKSDIILKPVLLDMYTAYTVQYAKIGKFLNEKSSEYTSSVEMDEKRLDIKVGSTPKVIMSWEDTEAIRILKNEQTVKTLQTKNSVKDEAVELPLQTNQISSGKLALEGTLNEKNVWRKILNYRVIPASRPITAKTVLKPSDFSIFNYISASEDGWSIDASSIKLGSTFLYNDNVHTEASLFVVPAKGLKLSFSADIQTELNFDFFQVVIVMNGEETPAVLPISGPIGKKTYSIDLSAYSGKEIEIRFKFDSDEGTTLKGIILNRFQLTST